MDMKIAIVGSSRINDEERELARPIIRALITTADEVITGDAKGIDELVRSFANECNCMTVIKALNKRWGPNGYKDRNKMIAKQADMVYSIATRQV